MKILRVGQRFSGQIFPFGERDPVIESSTTETVALLQAQDLDDK